MVEKEPFLFLLIGQDSPAKDQALAKIRSALLSKQTEEFNLDILYARELNLKTFQERVLALPVKTRKRLIIVRQAQSLKPEIREFILRQNREWKTRLALVLDVLEFEHKDDFFREISKVAQVFRFQNSLEPDTFVLNRQIRERKTDAALRILNQLLSNGEKPERIMGGLRYAWERDPATPQELKKRLRLLLNCDLEIKRGRLNPDFALEKLVISLCSLRKP